MNRVDFDVRSKTATSPGRPVRRWPSTSEIICSLDTGANSSSVYELSARRKAFAVMFEATTNWVGSSAVMAATSSFAAKHRSRFIIKNAHCKLQSVTNSFWCSWLSDDIISGIQKKARIQSRWEQYHEEILANQLRLSYFQKNSNCQIYFRMIPLGNFQCTTI